MAAEGDPLDDEDLLAEDRELEEREECVGDILELIVERVNAHLEAAELQGKVTGYAVREAVKDALAVVDMTFLERESFAMRGVTATESTVGSWEPDDDFTPGPNDAWARGTVKARRRQRTATNENATSSARHTIGGVEKHINRISRASNTIGAVEKQNRKSLAATMPLPKPKPRKSKLTGEAAEREQRLRDEIETRKAMQKLQRLQLQKDQEDLKQLEVLQKSLRGREYTYDHNGQVVFVNKPNTEKLPAYGAGLRVNVPETSGGLQTHGKYKRFANVGSSKLMETDFIEKEKSSQPSALEVMQMAKGVTLREGGGAKAGPPVGSSKQNMSRKDFLELYSDPSAKKQWQRGDTTDGGLGTQEGKERVVQPDPNLKLLSAADWGANPPAAMKENPYVPPSMMPKAKTPMMRQRRV